jgi:hypothetical protein
MSKRRQSGDIVRKKKNGGYWKEELLIKLLPNKHPESCLLGCEDKNCVEWTTCLILTTNYQMFPEYCYHVSECEMEDL